MKIFSRARFLSVLTGGGLLLEPNISQAKVAKTPSAVKRKWLTDLSPYGGPWGQSQILHLLRRSLFGVSHDDYRFFAGLDLSKSLNVLLKQSPAAKPPVNAYNTKSFMDPMVPFGQTWINARPDPSDLDEKRTLSLKAWWIGLMINQDRSLTEKMTLFWSNHLATQAHSVVDSRYDYKYVALLRSSALGNFKRLVRDVTTDQAMLLHLNGDLNTASAPNENYGRELQELFTVGKGPDSHYTQGDVEAAARILTGWSDGPTAAPSLVFNPANHDTGDKKFSSFYYNTVIKGRSGPEGAGETDDLIDMIFRQRETAKYFCRKLYRWFIYYDIDEYIEKNVIDPLADVLIENHFEVIPVLRMLLQSEHFFDTQNVGCQIKNPIDLLVGTCRQFQVAFPPSSEINIQYEVWAEMVKQLKLMGMEPDEPLNVAGWPAYSQEPGYYENWINSNTFSVRNSVTDQLSSQRGLPTVNNAIKLDLIRFTDRLSDPSNPDLLISESTTLLSPNVFDARERAFLKSIILPGQLADRNWTELWNRYKADPEDMASYSLILNRLTQYYTYILQRPEYQLA
jgi:uncharacterized protein (DUF1800 family)